MAVSDERLDLSIFDPDYAKRVKEEHKVEPATYQDITGEMLNSIETMDEYCKNKGSLGGLSWGMQSFNKAFDGLQPGLILIAGAPNTGKSALCLQAGWKIAQANKEPTPETPYKAYVLYFSLDDNTNELLPRLIAMDKQIEINIVKAPTKYQQETAKIQRRTQGVENLKNSLDMFKIIDSTKGTSIEYISSEIDRHYNALKQENENYKLVVMIDNFHDITTTHAKGSDDNAKFDYICDSLSGLCTQYDIPIICTAEFRKLNGARRPTMDDIRSTTKIGYEAKAILLCYNEVGLKGSEASIYWNMTGIDTPDYKRPVLETKIGKNKYSSDKGRMFFEFRPEMSHLTEVIDPSKNMLYASMITG